MAKYYRLRSVCHLLGHFQELERQEIYFASPAELNDPTEGLAYMVWRGDQIAWTNFFTHYLRCLHTMCIRAILEPTVQKGRIPVQDPLDNDLPSQYNHQLPNIISAVFDKLRLHDVIKARLTYKRTISVEEVMFWLQHVHSQALIDVRNALRYDSRDADANRLSDLASQLDLSRLIREIQGVTDASLENALRDTMRHSVAQDLVRKCRLAEPSDAHDTTSRLIIFDFPSLYLKELERLLYPNWYVACFMDTYQNSSVWGHYGDGHRGVCLIFDAVQTLGGDQALMLTRAGADNSHDNDVTPSLLAFRPVQYHKTRPEIEFFFTINRLSKQTLLKQWFTDDDGRLSRCASRLTATGNAGEWRQAYWDGFFRNITSKSNDWRYESESRLVVYGDCGTFGKRKGRPFKYSLRSLKGIIFGVATADNDKVKIVDIILRKCRERGRTDFRFYQAYYCRSTGRIRKYELALAEITN